jgi:FKBP-type peptidyl-prolyl cis-trans isomerase (trigger factor)
MAEATTKKSKSQTTSKTDSRLTWLPKKTFELELTIPWEEVQKTYQKVLSNTAKDITIKGFRQGKAPLNMVETHVGKATLYEKTVQIMVTDSYIEAVKKHNLRPIIHPQIVPISLEENKDWIVKATSCEPPGVDLANYKDAVKGLKAKSTIWTPDKAGQDEKEKPTGPTIDQILEEVIKTAKVEIPEVLLEQEVNRLLSNTIDQVNSMGMTIDQYLQSRGKSSEQLRHEYRHSAENSLKLEFIMAKIALENNIDVDNKEIEDIIAKTQEPTAKKALESQEQQNYLKAILRRQKTLDFLKSL